MLSGCTSNERLDAMASAMIRDYWAASVGHEQQVDPQPIPSASAALTGSSEARSLQPATRSPRAEDLPARPADDELDPLNRELPDLPADAPSFNLTDALAYAIDHSREYRNQKENLFITALNLLRERHLWGPRFFDTLSAGVSGTPEAGDHDQALEVVNSFRVTQRLPDGGDLSATALVNFVHLLNDTSNGGGEGQDASLTLSARVPLLRGAGWVAREDLIQAERDLIYAARSFERFRRQFFFNVSSRYYDLLQQQAALANQKRQLGSFQWLARRTQAFAEGGEQPFFEVQRAQQQVLFARNNLINTQERYDRDLDSFKLLLGMATEAPLRILPTEVKIPQPALDDGDAVRTALSLRLDLQTIYDRVDDARRGVEVARNDLKADLDLAGSVTLNTDANKTRAGADFDLGSSSYNLGVTYALPLDRQIEQIAYRRALVDLERAERTHTQQRDTIVQEVRSSIRQIHLAQATLELQKQNIEVARKRLRGVVLRLRSLGPRDFIEAEGDLLEAENRLDEAVRDLRVSILRYLLDTGQMRISATGAWQPPAQLTQATEKIHSPSPDQLLRERTMLQEYDDQAGKKPPAAEDSSRE